MFFTEESKYRTLNQSDQTNPGLNAYKNQHATEALYYS
jgi:hypothetical protein